MLIVRWESAGSPLVIRWESAGSPLGIRWESTDSLLGVGSPLGVYEMVSLEGLSKCALQIETFLKFVESLLGVHWKSTGSPLGVCWESA